MAEWRESEVNYCLLICYFLLSKQKLYEKTIIVIFCVVYVVVPGVNSLVVPSIVELFCVVSLSLVIENW